MSKRWLLTTKRKSPIVRYLFCTIMFLASAISATSQESIIDTVETYTVQDGDTIYRISQKVFSEGELTDGAHWLAIFAYNVEQGTINPKRTPITLGPKGLFLHIQVGQKLQIPHFSALFPAPFDIVRRFGVVDLTGAPVMQSQLNFDPMPTRSGRNVQAVPKAEASTDGRLAGAPEAVVPTIDVPTIDGTEPTSIILTPIEPSPVPVAEPVSVLAQEDAGSDKTTEATEDQAEATTDTLILEEQISRDPTEKAPVAEPPVPPAPTEDPGAESDPDIPVSINEAAIEENKPEASIILAEPYPEIYVPTSTAPVEEPDPAIETVLAEPLPLARTETESIPTLQTPEILTPPPSVTADASGNTATAASSPQEKQNPTPTLVRARVPVKDGYEIFIGPAIAAYEDLPGLNVEAGLQVSMKTLLRAQGWLKDLMMGTNLTFQQIFTSEIPLMMVGLDTSVGYRLDLAELAPNLPDPLQLRIIPSIGNGLLYQRVVRITRAVYLGAAYHFSGNLSLDKALLSSGALRLGLEINYNLFVSDLVLSNICTGLFLGWTL